MRKSTNALVALGMFVITAGLVTAQSGYVPGQAAEAYAYTHGGYVGRAIVKVLQNGLLDVEIDEAFLPHTLAIVDMESAMWDDKNTAYYLNRGNEVRVAKYVEYDGAVYVGTTVGASLTYVEAGRNGEPAGGQDLELLILKNQETMAAYYGNIQNGRFKVLATFGGPATPVTKTSYGGVTKATSPGYWNFGQTWQGNIDAIEEFIEEYGSAFRRSEMTLASQADAQGLKFWSVADAVSGATNSDFKDYFALAQAAIAQLKMK
ncbi:MAG: hypothetical protein JW852_11525 [Spirochaetales bacterium]|nr:hypothetical protein [Spirochaetales bacterium]